MTFLSERRKFMWALATALTLGAVSFVGLQVYNAIAEGAYLKDVFVSRPEYIEHLHEDGRYKDSRDEQIKDIRDDVQWMRGYLERQDERERARQPRPTRSTP
jgi:hypothetical protein